MTHDPISPMERRLLEAFQKSLDVQQSQAAQIADLQKQLAEARQRMQTLEEGMGQILSLLGKSFLPNASS